ncbi:hypothetical protein Q4E93_21780 [Flavitalea sp. BT771]|uniref:hypothetical protein n=1 Tax=Flavitalea sp. BT771 TaxID=3063329 RepID=UPI0026E2195B|nr:hypothetical protein [Flavitalea sp. BT771]MDO6433256.1 hypothetical protein [Flavitalea sp. BT771]
MVKSNDKYNVQDNRLNIGDREIVFDDVIKDVLEISDMLILLMLRPDGVFHNENVFGISLTEKKIRWQIAKLKYGSEDYCPFVGIKFYDNQLYLNNWCGIYLIVDPQTGQILERSLPARS